MGLTKISTDGFKDDAVTTDKLANAINTERTANTAKSTNATHTGEVTGSGALTITDDTVDEANLKISNAGSNGQFLQKQSGNTGGLTWASVTSTPEGTAILSTGESGGAKFLREDGDGSCSWQTVPAGGISDVVSDTSPQLGGNLDTNNKQILCGDSDSGNSYSNRVKLGAGEDLQLLHDGTNSLIINATGEFRIRGNSLKLQDYANGEDYVVCTSNGSVDLYYDDVKKFETESTGVRVHGALRLPDFTGSNEQLQLGDSQDLKIYHDGTTNIIEGLDSNMSIRPKTGENGILIRNNGSVDLYYDDAKKFETTSSGVTVTGGVNANARIYSSVSSATALQAVNTSSGTPTCIFDNGGGSGTRNIVSLRLQNSQKGYISTDGNNVSYNTSSDYRLKENVVNISDGITRLKQLKPRRFNWIADSSNTLIDGFLAHEVSTTIPEAVSGVKDEVDSDKKPIHQGLDYSKITPLLTAALQEAIAKIETLETKVAALEST